MVNNDLARAASSGVLDPKDAARGVSEIRKRAARLKENMALPEPDRGAKRTPPGAGAGPSGWNRCSLRWTTW